jgi:hypothetical protein
LTECLYQLFKLTEKRQKKLALEDQLKTRHKNELEAKNKFKENEMNRLKDLNKKKNYCNKRWFNNYNNISDF